MNSIRRDLDLYTGRVGQKSLHISLRVMQFFWKLLLRINSRPNWSDVVRLLTNPVHFRMSNGGATTPRPSLAVPNASEVRPAGRSSASTQGQVKCCTRVAQKKRPPPSRGSGSRLGVCLGPPSLYWKFWDPLESQTRDPCPLKIEENGIFKRKI